MGRIAVVGGGIQGCLVALQMEQGGHEVVVIDAADRLISRASLWNEGKLHLGYIYAADTSLRSARTMANGSFAFVGFIERLTGCRIEDSSFSRPFTYLVDRSSLLEVTALEAHYAACDEIIRECNERHGWSYPGYSGGPSIRRVTQSSIDEIAGDWCQAAFETVEVSVDPHVVAGVVRDAVDASSIEVLLDTRVDSISSADDGWALGCGDVDVGRFDRVVNAAWEDRLRLDAELGMAPRRPVLHRYKVAIHHTGPAADALPSVTIVLGPYGDVVSFGDRAYLSWYPVGRIGASTDLRPPRFEATLDEDRRSQILGQTVEALSSRLPAVDLVSGSLRDRALSAIEGGYVVAWGDADVDEHDSELHNRFDIGVTDGGSYLSVDTGKYCTSAAIANVAASYIGSA